ncbi:MAG TPA: competence protein CoiA family protein [Verrucomicrobiae bacterium]|nr:competence protein CoiA family protein [Verrucomicrobiae bacterium]
MQYALVNGQKREALPRLQGKCPQCSEDVIAKCGTRIIHHWAHARRLNCDPWWENETAWHRHWKNQFPEECREVSHTAITGEVHRADVKTAGGIIIEFQHSAITDEERAAREQFYENLVWVIDGNGFIENFQIFHRLPDPASEVAQDIVWTKSAVNMGGSQRGIFWRPSENPNMGLSSGELVRIHGIQEIQDKVDSAYRGHHQYEWIRPRRTWLDATCPVYIDFGENLVRLESYGEYRLPCIRMFAKAKILRDLRFETFAKSVGADSISE